MAFRAVGVGCSSILPCRSRSGRPRPVSCLGIVAFLSCWGCLRPFFNQPNDGGVGGGRGGGGSRGSDDVEDAGAPLVPTRGANNQAEDKRIRSDDSKNDDVEQLKLQLTEMLRSLSSSGNHLIKIVNSSSSLEHCVALIFNILSGMDIRSTSTTNRDSGTAAAVTNTTTNKDAMNRMKGLLGSMSSIADKLPMFCGPIFLWLLSNSGALNSPASKAGKDFKNPWMQIIITGNLILCFISFILMTLASKLKDSESIDGVLCKIFIWLLLPVFLTLWPGLCMILHFFAHTPVFVLGPLGVLFSILSLCFGYRGFYKEQQKILKELNEGVVLEKIKISEKPESEAALAKV